MDGAWKWGKNVKFIMCQRHTKRKSRSGNGSFMKILLPHCGWRCGNGSRMMVGVEMGKKCYVRHVEKKVKPDQLDASLTSLKGNESQA